MNNLSISTRDTSPIIPATARGEATRRKLLDAGEKEFGEKGFHAASVSSITIRAGVGQGTFYLYFHSKEEIFSTLVKEIGHELRRRMAAAVTAASGLSSAAHGGVGAFLHFAQQHPGLFRIVQESQFVDEPAYRAYYRLLVQGYSSGLKEAELRGHVCSGDAEVRAWAVIGIAHFFGLRYCLWEGRLPDAPVMEEVARFITRAMGTPGGEPPLQS